MNTQTGGGTLSESDRTSKKKYKRLVKRLTSQRDSSHSELDLSNDNSFYDGDSSQSDVPADDEDLKNYVKDFRKKVIPCLQGPREVHGLRNEPKLQISKAAGLPIRL